MLDVPMPDFEIPEMEPEVEPDLPEWQPIPSTDLVPITIQVVEPAIFSPKPKRVYPQWVIRSAIAAGFLILLVIAVVSKSTIDKDRAVVSGQEALTAADKLLLANDAVYAFEFYIEAIKVAGPYERSSISASIVVGHAKNQILLISQEVMNQKKRMARESEARAASRFMGN